MALALVFSSTILGFSHSTNPPRAAFAEPPSRCPSGSKGNMGGFGKHFVEIHIPLVYQYCNTYKENKIRTVCYESFKEDSVFTFVIIKVT